MPWCPSCRSEYRDGFTICASCQVELVAELPPEVPLDAAAVEAAVAEGQALVVARGGYDAARRMQDALAYRRVPSVIVGVPDTAGDGGVYAAYEVVVHPDAADDARSALMADFQEMLTAEGLDGESADAVIDLDAGEDVTCPACGTTFSLAETAECPECGLYLGVHQAETDELEDDDVEDSDAIGEDEAVDAEEEG